MRLCSFLACIAVMLPAPVIAKPGNDAGRAREAKVRQAVEDIKKQCGITTGQFSYDAGSISLHYDGMIEPEKLDCASDSTALLGIGFDSYNSAAPYSGPRRFIVKGPSKRLDAIAQDVVAAHWTITHRADAGDGMGFLEIETPTKASRSEVREFLDRFQGDFRDVPIGLAPMTRAGYDLPTTATEFRNNAREMYQKLKMAWCETPIGFSRDALLKPDRDAVASLERKVSTTAANAHLAIAREDVDYKLSKETGCWMNYNDTSVTKQHAEMIHKAISVYDARLAKLAPAVERLPAGMAPANAAEFRYQVRQLTEWTLPLCSYTTKGSNQAVFAASLKQIGLFEDRLHGTQYAAQYAIAKEDASYARSQKVAECDDPGRDSVAKLSTELLGYAKKEITQLEKLVLR